jgi:hypothetical protein
MTIQEDLIAAAEQAGFTHQDMATWLEYGYSTVQYWFAGMHQPIPVKQKHVAKRLKLLRDVLKHEGAGFPIPPSVTQYERAAYIEGVRSRALKGIFKQGASD